MGTRCHIRVIDKKGDLKVSQYCQWDGYPQYTGVKILKFLKEQDLNKFYENVTKLKRYNIDEIEKIFSIYRKSTKNTFTEEEYKELTKAFPELSRNTGKTILYLILNDNIDIVNIDEDFNGNEYIIDFKENIFKSTYNNKTSTHLLNHLPTEKQYLKDFKIHLN